MYVSSERLINLNCNPWTHDAPVGVWTTNLGSNDVAFSPTKRANIKSWLEVRRYSYWIECDQALRGRIRHHKTPGSPSIGIDPTQKCRIDALSRSIRGTWLSWIKSQLDLSGWYRAVANETLIKNNISSQVEKMPIFKSNLGYKTEENSTYMRQIPGNQCLRNTNNAD